MGRAEEIFGELKSGGYDQVVDLIDRRTSEELYLDFKRSSSGGTGNRLSDIDRKNLGRAISGFGNSEGGVIVWGVDCSLATDGADVATAVVPIEDAARFVSWLEGAVSGVTLPAHSTVQHLAIPQQGSPNGCVATLVPKSDAAPHQTINDLRYYMRAGSNFVPVPHGILAGMFGRRPQPHVVHAFTYEPMVAVQQSAEGRVALMLRNRGPGIASDMYASVWVSEGPGSRCGITFDRSDQADWTLFTSYGSKVTAIAKPSLRLPPEAELQPLMIAFEFIPPFERGIRLKGVAGAGTMPPYRFELGCSRETLERVYAKVMSGGADTSECLWEVLSERQLPAVGT